ncbi:MAG: hypothetical protein ABI854_06715 [Betaproteobacteria bacterium]
MSTQVKAIALVWIGNYAGRAGQTFQHGTNEMKAGSRSGLQILRLGAKPAWAEVWHLWNVVIPRRSITGRLVYGQVWRRHDGRHWIYKKFVEYADDL